MSGQPGQKNPNWKGGRSVASNGYVLIKAPGHPHADVRGYVYEHRMVAVEHIGRPLRPGEIVHHINGDKTDNRWSNLEVLPSRAHHHVEHRTSDRGLRLPDEPNEIVACVCGCGATFARYDALNRPRRYIPGHNLRELSA